jgi:SAM-dependent methyltransferase
MANLTGSPQIKKFYDDVYRSGDIRDNPKLYRWVMRLLRPAHSMRILDAGCGIGCLLNEAVKDGALAFGIDISYEAAAKAAKTLPAARVSVGDGEKIPFKDGSFDCVASLGSIEHFVSPENGIRELARVLKPGSRAVLLLPNSFYLGDILKVMRSGGYEEPWQIQEKSLTREGWKKAIEQNGFIVEETLGYNKFPEFFQPGTFKVKSVKKFINTFMMKRFCPLNLSWQFVYVCRKPR